MFGNARTAVKFFVYGLAIGLIFAPRSGEETRQRIAAWLTQTAEEVIANVMSGIGQASDND